jgi:4-azaleucine resistance transporter AzlC
VAEGPQPEAEHSPDRAPRSLRQILRLAAPLGAAVGIFGVSFGILARSAGLGWLAPLVMSATTFAGSAQFAAVSILASVGAAGVAAAVTAAVMLNTRYLPIGLSVAPALHGSAASRLLQGQLVVDESWAVANQGGGRFDRGTLLVTGAVLYVAWVAGTTIGVLGGSALGDPSKLGLDAAFPALFLALLAAQLRGRRARRSLAAAGLGGAIALVLLPFTPAGIPIVAASAACLIGLRGRPAPADGGAPDVDGLP